MLIVVSCLKSKNRCRHMYLDRRVDFPEPELKEQ